MPVKDKIPASEHRNIVALANQGHTYVDIARRYNVTGPAISYIVRKNRGLLPAQRKKPPQHPRLTEIVTSKQQAPAGHDSGHGPTASKAQLNLVPKADPPVIQIPIDRQTVGYQLIEASTQAASAYQTFSRSPSGEALKKLEEAMARLRRSQAQIEFDALRLLG